MRISDWSSDVCSSDLERIGSAAESAAPHNHYQSRDGRWVAVACTNDRMFARLAAAMGTPGLVERFPGMRERLAGRAGLDGQTGRATSRERARQYAWISVGGVT